MKPSLPSTSTVSWPSWQGVHDRDASVSVRLNDLFSGLVAFVGDRQAVGSGDHKPFLQQRARCVRVSGRSPCGLRICPHHADVVFAGLRQYRAPYHLQILERALPVLEVWRSRQSHAVAHERGRRLLVSALALFRRSVELVTQANQTSRQILHSSPCTTHMRNRVDSGRLPSAPRFAAASARAPVPVSWLAGRS